jgi:SAM-dependent methyltransferase
VARKVQRFGDWCKTNGSDSFPSRVAEVLDAHERPGTIAGVDLAFSQVSTRIPIRQRSVPAIHRISLEGRGVPKAQGEATMRLTKARSFWESNPEIGSKDQWTGNPLIGAAVYRRMSGGASSDHWLTWLFRDYFKKRRFARVLSPGCGVGDHEVAMMSFGTIGHLDAFDFSEASLRIAREKAEARNLKIHFYQDDINTFDVPAGRKYDLILCSGSVHHVREIERFLRVVRDALSPNGVFVFNEYVGPSYNIYPRKQLEIVNRLLQAISSDFRRAHRLDRNGVEQVLAHDPSESVRSSLILPFATTYFDFELCHPFGGAVLHPLYPLLDHDAMARPTPEMQTIVRLLIEFEAILLEKGVLASDFVLCVCRKN